MRFSSHDALGASRHRFGGSAGKRQEQHTTRIRALVDQVGDAVRERLRLAGAGTRDDQERRRSGGAGS
jgi:predicted RNase H-like nuclease (RuvC/YqgF family)